MYNLQSKQVAADVYHNYLDNVHNILEDFSGNAHYQSLDKMNVLWNQLHIASGAKYIYSDSNHSEFTHQWLETKGKIILNELINDAKKSKMKKSLKNLCELKGVLEECKIIH